VYRNIWTNKTTTFPQIGDYVENQHAERGIVTAMSELVVYVAVFGEYRLRDVPSVDFTRRWDVCR
jgi:hypothetical protein